MVTECMKAELFLDYRQSVFRLEAHILHVGTQRGSPLFQSRKGEGKVEKNTFSCKYLQYVEDGMFFAQRSIHSWTNLADSEGSGGCRMNSFVTQRGIDLIYRCAVLER